MDPRELMTVAETIAREAGALVREGRPDQVHVAKTKSSAVDVVTAMDIASEDLIRRRLAELRPGDGVLGEEHGLEAGTTGVTWVVDPIDGTVNYLYGIPAYGVSIAAVTGEPDPAGWTVQAGCVHSVADGRTWVAGRGEGAWSGERRLSVNPDRGLDGALVGTGFGYTEQRRRRQATVVAALLPRVRDIRRIGSAAIDLCQLAGGQLDAHYERGLNPWDLAAGALMVVEAGGVVTGLRGGPPGVAMTVAGPARLVGELAAVLEALDADADD
ncbi:inositol monophosphatase family protein [Actinotalea sp. M2MS4P-6]|uniref:inositol monophosphatase family protein n=1 Tax=Actinotalea sp. M2MS4P-6 TaxID=2983762 RepID=UPI00398C72A1